VFGKIFERSSDDETQKAAKDRPKSREKAAVKTVLTNTM
jgi:hypothetical protein